MKHKALVSIIMGGDIDSLTEERARKARWFFSFCCYYFPLTLILFALIFLYLGVTGKLFDGDPMQIGIMVGTLVFVAIGTFPFFMLARRIAGKALEEVRRRNANGKDDKILPGTGIKNPDSPTL